MSSRFSSSEILLFIATLIAFPSITETLTKAATKPLKNELLRSPLLINDDGFGLHEALPKEVFESRWLAQSMNLRNFTISDGMKKDPLIQQRMMEALYPRLPSADSPRVFYMKSEELPKYCQVLEEKESVLLAYCR